MATPWALAAALTNAAGVWRGLYSHRLSHPVLRIGSHTAPFRGSAIVPTILSFLSRALKRPVPLYTRHPSGWTVLDTCRRGRTPRQPYSPKYLECTSSEVQTQDPASPRSATCARAELYSLRVMLFLR